MATALRLWCKRELPAVARRVLELQQVLLRRAEEAGEAYLPGYTHLQRAQPVLLAHHLLAHGWALARDVDRLLATVARLDVSPLGAGALAGSSLPLDPAFTAAALGFAAPFENSLDAVSDRDFVAEALFDLALVGLHLSRLGEEWVLWTSEEFGFARLADAYATGSSMLPQKKNPDIAELARGKAGRLVGDLTGLLATLKGLPLAYNRDLQEDKEPLFDAVDQVPLALAADHRHGGHGDVRPRADAGRRRQPDERGHRPGRAAGGRRECRSGRPTRSWARWCAPRSSLAAPPLRRAGGGAPGPRARGRRAPRCRASRCAGARRGAAPVRRRWREQLRRFRGPARARRGPPRLTPPGHVRAAEAWPRPGPTPGSKVPRSEPAGGDEGGADGRSSA